LGGAAAGELAGRAGEVVVVALLSSVTDVHLILASTAGQPLAPSMQRSLLHVPQAVACCSQRRAEEAPRQRACVRGGLGVRPASDAACCN
jgi:hypothetical protein